MRKEKDNRELDIDLLLRETAEQENRALPLDDWKRQLYKKIESDDQPRREEAPVADELAARRRRNLRKLAVGFSTVAAALIILLGTRQYWQENLNAKAAPQQEQEVRMAVEEAPFGAASTDAAMPEAMLTAPESPALEAPDAEPPAATKGSTGSGAAPAPSLAAEDGGENNDQAQAGILSDTLVLTPEEQQAVDAVNALLPENRGKVEAASALVLLLENATIAVRPISGGELTEVTRPRIYQVIADPAAEGTASYAVDADTYEVLGEIVGE